MVSQGSPPRGTIDGRSVDGSVNADGYRHDALIAVDLGGSLRPILGVEILLGWGWDGFPALPPDLADVVHPGRLGEVEALLGSASSPAGTRVAGSVRLRHADGRWLSMVLEVEAHTHNPAVAANVLRFRPATGSDDAATSAAEQFELLADVVASGILTADEDGFVLFANPAARELFWRSEQDLLADGWLEAVHPADRVAVQAAADRAHRRGTNEVIDFRIPVSGLERWLRGRFSAIPGLGDASSGWVAMFEDTTVDRAGVIELAHQATHDSLTGLANRGLLEDRMANALARAKRNGDPLAVFFCDLDRFKAANDRHGHQVGDDLLREVSERLRRTVRAEDTVARLGGDEFVIVAEGIEHADAAQLAARIAEEVAEPIAVDEGTVVLGVSIGVAWVTDADHRVDELLAMADEAMYQAKSVRLGLVMRRVD